MVGAPLEPDIAEGRNDVRLVGRVQVADHRGIGRGELLQSAFGGGRSGG